MTNNVMTYQKKTRTIKDVIKEMEEYTYIDTQRAIKFAKQIAKIAKQEEREKAFTVLHKIAMETKTPEELNIIEKAQRFILINKFTNTSS